MERVKRIDCPHCQAPLSSARGIRIGGKTTCSRCGTSFIVRTEDARDAVVSGGMNWGRGALVAPALPVSLGGGAALGVYCFSEQQRELPDAVASAPPPPTKAPEPPPEQP